MEGLRHGPKKSPLTIGENPNEMAKPQLFFSLSLTLGYRTISVIFLINGIRRYLEMVPISVKIEIWGSDVIFRSDKMTPERQGRSRD